MISPRLERLLLDFDFSEHKATLIELCISNDEILWNVEFNCIISVYVGVINEVQC